MTPEELAEGLRLLAESTPGPWEIGTNYWTAGVNDGTHRDWRPPRTIAPGECTYCWNPDGILVEAFSKGGESFHTHRFTDDKWHDIVSAKTRENITGNYDYEAGGVSSSEADARLIVWLRNHAEELLRSFRA